jgi:hypothetical protein
MASVVPVNDDAAAPTVMAELMEEGRVEIEMNVSAVSVATATAITETYAESTRQEVGGVPIVSVVAKPIETTSSTVTTCSESSLRTGVRAEFLTASSAVTSEPVVVPSF